MDLNGLFSLDPVRRFDASAGFAVEDKQRLLADWPVDFPQVIGSRNAWLVSVGPSPGLGKGPRKPGHESTATHRPILGEPCEFFKGWNTPFGNRMLNIVHLAFQETGLSPSASESLFLHMNLDTTLEGLEARIGEGKLRTGLDRLRIVLEKAKPRLVVALTKETYKTIREGASGGALLPDICVEGEQPHEEAADGKRYRWNSCWLATTEAIFLTGILQHPSRGATVTRYEERVGKYLAACTRQIVCSLPSKGRYD